jgi:hypothetical protein
MRHDVEILVFRVARHGRLRSGRGCRGTVAA